MLTLSADISYMTAASADAISVGVSCGRECINMVLSTSLHSCGAACTVEAAAARVQFRAKGPAWRQFAIIINILLITLTFNFVPGMV